MTPNIAIMAKYLPSGIYCSCFLDVECKNGWWEQLLLCCDRPNCTWHTPMVAGINYIPAEAKALPREGGIGSCMAKARVCKSQQ